MNDQTDSQLLRGYAEHRSEPAFAELVRRHVDFVYSAALRMVRDSHLAQDITQGVFVALAKNSAQLLDRPVLSGWLHRTAQNIAAQTVRTDVRRRAREQEAAAMNELLAHESESAWENIAPHLDAALGELSEPDRDALLLRYFERKSAREMAQTLNVSEEAAQKRVNRAVERLREHFTKRNVTIGASGLVVIISTNAIQAAPIGLINTISTAVALAGTTVTATATLTTTKAIIMTTLQKTSIAVAIVVAGIATPLIMQHKGQADLRMENASLRQQVDQLAQLKAQNERLSNLVSQATPLSNDDQLRELLKLRGEVGQLRNQKGELEKLRTENRQLRSTSTSRPTPQPAEAAGDYFPKEAWAFAGYADPESAFQSAAWAMAKGDLKTMLASVVPEERARMEKEFAGKSEDEIAVAAGRDVAEIKGFRILKKDALFDGQVVLTIFGDGKNETVQIKFKRVGNEWKMAGPVKDKPF